MGNKIEPINYDHTISNMVRRMIRGNSGEEQEGIDYRAGLLEPGPRRPPRAPAENNQEGNREPENPIHQQPGPEHR